MTDSRRQLEVVDRADAADGVARLTLAGAGGPLPDWTPGAHIDLVGPEGLVRQYSLCGEPGEDRWQIAVLRVTAGRGGSAWVHDELTVGAEVETKGPRNQFPLEDAEDYLFVAGGIGITPLLPMVRELERRGRAWRMVYGGRSRASMAFVEELREIGGDRVVVVPEDEAGLIDLPHVLGEPVEGRRVYGCGPEPLLAALEDALLGRPEELHVERFAPTGPVDLHGDAFEVELASSQRRIRVEADQSIIDALADAGVDVDFSCREGTCGTCETAVLGGVPDHRDSILTEEERAANDCMFICVGRCRQGPLVLDL